MTNRGSKVNLVPPSRVYNKKAKILYFTGNLNNISEVWVYQHKAGRGSKRCTPPSPRHYKKEQVAHAHFVMFRCLPPL